jgi:hypothetical protein
MRPEKPNNQRRFRNEVEHGVAVARAWCGKNNIERS